MIARMRDGAVRGVVIASALFVVGCGRSSPWGERDNSCPAGVICIVTPDMARVDMRARDMSLDMGRDMRPTDMRGDMKPVDMRGDLGGGDLGGCGITIPCDDPRCIVLPECTPGHEICDNGIDDDGNGLTDCADPACFNDPFCRGRDGGSDMALGCRNPDGSVNCDQPGCNTLPECLQQSCAVDVDFGTVTPRDYDQTRALDTRGASAQYETCAFPGGTARVAMFTLTAVADVRLDFTQASGAAHVVALARAGFGQRCDANRIYCLPANEAPSATHTFAQLGPGSYYLIVQSFPGTQGATTVRLSTGKSTTPEICDNGIDDDGNGLIDCADYACVNAPNCVALECKPDVNLGVLVVGEPSKSADFDTRSSQNRYHPTCSGVSTGKDYALRYTLKETASVLIDWTQNNGSNHVLSLFALPPPGIACDADELRCFATSGASSGELAFSAPRPAGDYLLIVKALNAGDEGPVHISIRAYRDRLQEICNNGVDDDNNGLIDCADPACAGIDGCKPPICIEDADLGDFSWGTQRSTAVDVTTGVSYYSARCAQGGGKTKVVRVRLLQPMGLGYSCTESGSQVLQLTQLVQPLDACDANPVNCADPTVLPFGCNFVMPNLQPGTYDILVQAFASGMEGSVDLTLYGVQEQVLEICDNGIDDDGNGLIDCMDPACFTSPLCQKLACMPDKTLGLLALDGSITSTTVQTSGNGDKFRAPCASAGGGQDAVVDFTLPTRADLTIRWAQVGNHDFALYTDVNDGAACNAGSFIRCTASAGSATGSYQLSGLAGGKYHLVVDADRAGSEGGVVLQLSGTPAM
jgi:hypothetical protein